MKRLTIDYGLKLPSVILPAVIIALSSLNPPAQGQSQPKQESPGAVDSSEIQESFSQEQDMPILEAPVQPNNAPGVIRSRGPEIDSDIELFTDQGKSVVIEPMSPDDLQLAPGLEGPLENMPSSIIVVEPDLPLLPDVEQTPSFGGSQPVPELRRYRPEAALPNPQTLPCPHNLPRPRLGVTGELIRGWGFQVAEVFPGSAAARMQLEPGDVILNINGRYVSSVGAIEQQLLRSVGEFKGQGVIKIDNVRGRTRCGASSKRFLWLKFQL